MTDVILQFEDDSENELIVSESLNCDGIKVGTGDAFCYSEVSITKEQALKLIEAIKSYYGE